MEATHLNRQFMNIWISIETPKLLQVLKHFYLCTRTLLLVNEESCIYTNAANWGFETSTFNSHEKYSLIAKHLVIYWPSHQHRKTISYTKSYHCLRIQRKNGMWKQSHSDLHNTLNISDENVMHVELHPNFGPREPLMKVVYGPYSGLLLYLWNWDDHDVCLFARTDYYLIHRYHVRKSDYLFQTFPFCKFDKGICDLLFVTLALIWNGSLLPRNWTS